MPKTKQKILDAALKLFNERGLVNVRLQHIADEAFVSVGNLAYHYPNKEAIVMALYETITKQQAALLAEYRIVPLFDNIDRLIWHTFKLQQNHIFFYLDTLEIVRAYPAIGEKHQQQINHQVNQLANMILFNVSRGALMEEPSKDIYPQLALNIWQTMDLWLTQQTIRVKDNNDHQAYRTAVWSLLIPFFTPMGRMEYEQMLQMPYGFYE